MNNQLKPIENWKFNVQIILASLIILLSCFNGLKYIITEATGEKFVRLMYLSYVSVLIWLAIFIFQRKLFQSYPKISNLFLWVIIIKLVLFFFGLIEQFVFKNAKLQTMETMAMLEGILRLGSIIMSLVLFGHIFTKQYNNAPLVKMFRPYAVITIIMDCFNFLFNFLVGLSTILHISLYKLWGLSYFFYMVPLVFLIIYYIKLKEVYPQLQKGTDQTDDDKLWPPQQT